MMAGELKGGLQEEQAGLPKICRHVGGCVKDETKVKRRVCRRFDVWTGVVAMAARGRRSGGGSVGM